MIDPYRLMQHARRRVARFTPVIVAVVVVGGAIALSVPAPEVQGAPVRVHVGSDHRLMINTVLDETPPRVIAAPVGVTLASRADAAPAPTVVRELSDYVARPTATDVQVVRLIHRSFPARAWDDAVSVAWCESRFRPRDIDYDTNGTHDRGIFQLNDGGTEQSLLGELGYNPNDLGLAFNAALNVRAAAVLYARDGWSQWTCQPEVAS